MIKEIRILSGLHRGAKLQLTAGSWRIGSDHAADVQISDWQHAALTLVISDAGHATLGSDDADAVITELRDMQPVIFDNIVVCIGDVDAVWPCETVLEHRTTQVGAASEVAGSDGGHGNNVLPGLPVLRKTPPKRWLMLASVALTMSGSGVALSLGMPSRADVLPEAAMVLRQVQDGLSRLHQTSLEVQSEGELIVVRGMVSNNAELFSVRQMLETVAPRKARMDVTAVSDVIANIQQSLHDNNLTVSYAGQGNFIVSGAARNKAAVQTMLMQMATDFGTSVKHIEVNLTAAPRAWAMADSDSALVVDSLQYIQALDGTKRFPTVQDE